MKNKGKDYSQIIIWSSALVGMVRYAAAFLSSDIGEITGRLSEIVTVSLGVSGFFMGILGTLGTVYIFDGWRQKMPAATKRWSNKFIALTVFVFAAFLAEVLILVPFTMSRVLHVSVAAVLNGGVWWWSTAVVVMPLLLIGGVSVGNQIVTVKRDEQAGEQTRTETNGSANGSRTYKSLSNSDKYYILNNKSELASNEYGVTSRAIQKWRVKIQGEIKNGKLLVERYK